jgi:neutral/alkaline ceramidase-like enzyme
MSSHLEFHRYGHLMHFLKIAGVVLFSTVCALADAEEWKAGVASVAITPTEPIHLLGYPNRSKPFESVNADIYAKALAIEDSDGNRGVIVTSDLVGFQDAYSSEICRRISEHTKLERRQIILNASHNHTGPLISLDPMKQGNLAHGPMSDAEAQRTIKYSHDLQEKIVKLVDDALADLRPAQLSWATNEVGFVMNRRVGKPGAISMAANPQGVVDRSVPVLKVALPDGRIRCVLFGCACHNTTLTPDHNLISGDYAGFAQDFLQRKYPGATALFMSGCGADANPEPRGSIDEAKQHGTALADAVIHALDGRLTALHGPLHTDYKLVDLPLMHLTKDDLAKYVARGNVQAMMAQHMQQLVDKGEKLPATYAAPVAVWRFGDGLSLVALPGEGVAGYVSLIQQRLRSRPLWISSYNNDCFGYLPTAQIVREGGHEAIGVTVWFWGNHLANRAGFFQEDVERAIVNAVGELAQ